MKNIYIPFEKGDYDMVRKLMEKAEADGYVSNESWNTNVLDDPGFNCIYLNSETFDTKPGMFEVHFHGENHYRDTHTEMSPEEYLNESEVLPYKYIAIVCNSMYEAAAAIYTLLADGNEAQWMIPVYDRLQRERYLDEDDDLTVEELAEEFDPSTLEHERKSMVVLELNTRHIFVRRNAFDLPNETRIISIDEYYNERSLLSSPATTWWNKTNEMVQFYLANKYYKKNPTDLSNKQINNIYKKEWL